jgi:hypothetical protein
MSTEKNAEQAALSPPLRKSLADHPFIKSVESGQFTLLYGLEVHRDTIRYNTFQTLGIDVQGGKLTIDNFNNLCLALFSDSKLQTEKVLTGNKKIDDFMLEHIENIRHFTSVTNTDLSSLLVDETPVINYACQSAISTCHRHDIQIFFILDGIDWDELNGVHKDDFTTQELRYLLSEYQKSPSNIEHVTFVQGSCIVDTNTIMAQLDASFAEVRRTATHATSAASDDSHQLAPPPIKRLKPSKLTFHPDPAEAMQLPFTDLGESAADDDLCAEEPSADDLSASTTPSLAGLSFTLFNRPPRDIPAATASAAAPPDRMSPNIDQNKINKHF